MDLEIRISVDDFDVGHELRALYQRSDGALGAVASFVGLVRDRFEAESVIGLHLEHYPGMTETSIEKIAREAEQRWPLLDVLIIHRVGDMAARDQIVYVQVGSGHRDSAFAGAEFIMDYLKTDAVFWKREAREDAVRWIEATSGDQARRAAWSADSKPEN